MGNAGFTLFLAVSTRTLGDHRFDVFDRDKVGGQDDDAVEICLRRIVRSTVMRQRLQSKNFGG